MINQIFNEDCLIGMTRIPDKSVDMILCDLPYGTTASKWDKTIDVDILWREYERIIKDNGAIVLTASGQFTHKIIQSNTKLYRYKWIWIKSSKGNFVNANNRPLTQFEEILVFSKGHTANGSKNKMEYHPQGIMKIEKKVKPNKHKFGGMAGSRPSHKKEYVQKYTNYPSDVLTDFTKKPYPLYHPTQKPIGLFEYLIKTYTSENDVVLDNCIGVGTTALACINSNRRYIGFELDEGYYTIAKERIKHHLTEGSDDR